MKRILLTSALTLALTGAAAFAQDSTTTQVAPPPSAPMHQHHHFHHADPQHQAAALSKRLNLSADQSTKLEPIFADQDQKVKALFQNSSLTPDQRHEQMRTIHESTQQQLAGVLTPDQLQQLKAMRHNHHRFNKNGAAQPGSQPQPDQQQAQPQAPPSGL